MSFVSLAKGRKMANPDHPLTLPDAHKLARLRRIGLTCQEIGNFCGVSGGIIRNELEKQGRLKRGRHLSNPDDFWQKASTALALIRCGHATYEALRPRLGYRSRSAAYYLVDKLIALGWVSKTPGKAATLRLTTQGEQIGALIVPVRPHQDYGLVVCRYPPPNPRGKPNGRKNEYLNNERDTIC
jgi:hypothetical protein